MGVPFFAGVRWVAGGQRRPPLRMTRNFVQVRERGDVVGIAPYEILSVNTP